MLLFYKPICKSTTDEKKKGQQRSPLAKVDCKLVISEYLYLEIFITNRFTKDYNN